MPGRFPAKTKTRRSEMRNARTLTALFAGVDLNHRPLGYENGRLPLSAVESIAPKAKLSCQSRFCQPKCRRLLGVGTAKVCRLNRYLRTGDLAHDSERRCFLPTNHLGRYGGSTGLRGTVAVAACGIEFDPTKRFCPGSRTVRPDCSYQCLGFKEGVFRGGELATARSW